MKKLIVFIFFLISIFNISFAFTIKGEKVSADGSYFNKNDIHKTFYFSNFSKNDNKELRMISEAVNSDGYKNMFSNGKCIFWKKNNEIIEKSILSKCIKKHKKLILFRKIRKK